MKNLINKTYDFESVDEVVKMTPMKFLFCERIMKAFKRDMEGKIQKDCCYVNALIAADWFNKHGFDVEVVDGYYGNSAEGDRLCRVLGIPVNEINHIPTEHRFCKKGDKYFDPTIEFVYNDVVSMVNKQYRLKMTATDMYFYRAKRIFDFNTLMEYSLDMVYFYGAEFCCSTLTGRNAIHFEKKEDDISLNWGALGEDGRWIAPEINPLDVLRDKAPYLLKAA